MATASKPLTITSKGIVRLRLPTPVVGVRATDMKPPIIACENGDINLFKSIDDAMRYIEPIDIINNEYIVYDSEGFFLNVIPTTPVATIAGRASEAPQVKQLFETLSTFVERTGAKPTPAETLSLEALIQYCIGKFGYAV